MNATNEQPKNPHISASQLSMYQRCGEAYRFRYVDGIIIPPNRAMIRGTSIHKARQKNLTQKMTSGVDLSVDEVMETARDTVVGEFEKSVMLEDGETVGIAKAATIDGATRMAACDLECHQKLIVPKMVEKAIRVNIPGLGRDILGYLDTADSSNIVRDLKSMSKTPAADAAAKSDQLTTYALLFKVETGNLPAAVQLDAVVDLKGGPKASVVRGTRTDDDLNMILRRYFVAIQGIEKGVFIPCPSDHWGCNPKWCGYFAQCPYARRGDNRPTE